MHTTSFTVGQRRYNMSFEKIAREEGLYIYWGTIHLSGAIEFSCMRIDDNPIFITTPITLPSPVELAILDAIQQTENNNHMAVAESYAA